MPLLCKGWQSYKKELRNSKSSRIIKKEIEFIRLMWARHYFPEGNSQLSSNTNDYCCFLQKHTIEPPLESLRISDITHCSLVLILILIISPTVVELEWFTEYVTWLHQLVWFHILSTSLTLTVRWDRQRWTHIVFMPYIFFQSYKLSLNSNLKFVFNTMRAAKESSLF